MKSFESFRTARTLIRRFQTDDKDKLIELLCDPSVTRNMAFPDELLTKEGVSNLLALTMDSYDSENPLLSFAIMDVHNGDFLGITGYNPLQNGAVEVFFAILPEYWGKGYASEICSALTAHIFENDTYKTIVAPVTQNNLASRRVVEKNGFINCGLKKDANYKDLVFIYKKEKTFD